MLHCPLLMFTCQALSSSQPAKSRAFISINIHRCIQSKSRYSQKGSLFFDRDYFPSKSLLQVLAQRLTRTSPSQASDQDCSSPSPMHLDGGQVDFGSSINVPFVNVQLHAPSDALSSSTGCTCLTPIGLPRPGHIVASSIPE